MPDLRMMNLLRVTVLITFLFYIDTTVSQKIEVGRFIIDNNWKNVKDLFNIPDSECEQNGRYGNYCLSVCGTGTGTGNPSYPCSCPNDNSTLTYFNNEWRCRENAEVREQLGECLFSSRKTSIRRCLIPYQEKRYSFDSSTRRSLLNRVS